MVFTDNEKPDLCVPLAKKNREILKAYLCAVKSADYTSIFIQHCITLLPATIPNKINYPNGHIEDNSNKLKYREKPTLIHFKLHDRE